MDTFRWLEILNNDTIKRTDVKLKNGMAELNHEWLNDKRSDKYLRFENYIIITLAAYQGYLLRYRNVIKEVELLLSDLKGEIEKRNT